MAIDYSCIWVTSSDSVCCRLLTFTVQPTVWQPLRPSSATATAWRIVNGSIWPARFFNKNPIDWTNTPFPAPNSFVPFELDFHLVVDLFIEHSNRISYLIWWIALWTRNTSYPGLSLLVRWIFRIFFFIYFPFFSFGGSLVFSISVRLSIAWTTVNVNQQQGRADPLSLHLPDRHPRRDWSPFQVIFLCAETIARHHIQLN